MSFWARCGPALSPSTGEPAAAGWPEGGSGARGRGKGRDRSAAKGAALCPQTPQRSPAGGCGHEGETQARAAKAHADALEEVSRRRLGALQGRPSEPDRCRGDQKDTSDADLRKTIGLLVVSIVGPAGADATAGLRDRSGAAFIPLVPLPHRIARMLQSRTDGDAPMSEKQVFESFRERLPNDWVVLHARRISLPSANEWPAQKCATDFLVLDPARDLLALEVKGGAIQCRDGQWTSIENQLRPCADQTDLCDLHGPRVSREDAPIVRSFDDLAAQSLLQRGLRVA